MKIKRKKVALLLLAVCLVYLAGCGGMPQKQDRLAVDEVQLTPDAKVVMAQQNGVQTWRGGAVQGFIALVQSLPEKVLYEKIKEEWYRRTGKCPEPEQTKQVANGWREFERWLKESGNPAAVQILSTFAFDHKGPGVEVMAALINGVSQGVAGFFSGGLASIVGRPNNFSVNGVSSSEGGNANPEINDSGNSKSTSKVGDVTSESSSTAIAKQKQAEAQQQTLNSGKTGGKSAGCKK
jgi:hypothetical protein